MKSLNLLLASKIAFYLVIFIYPISYVQNQETNTSKDLADAIAQFTAKLYSKSKNQTANYFISPYSIWMALSMCYVGAKGNTSSEMKNLLSYGKKSDLEIYQQIETYMRTVINATNVKYTLNLANRLYTNGSIKFNDQYINVLGKYFKADIEKLNFSNSVAAAETVNKFVSNKTNNLIKDIVEPNTIDKADLLVINTLYFKSYWLFRFKSTYTQKENFTSLNGRSISVDMMSLGSKNFNCWLDMKDYDLATACEIPYEDRKIAMTIILPKRNSSLGNLEKKLDLNSFKNIINSDKNITKANFYLPRFTIKYKQEMSKDLKSLGATTPFSDAADFSGISSSKKFKISQVIHQTYVNVNEEGTEAAAATLIEMLGSSPIPPIEFKCDRPFIFIIHDLTSKAILYIGKLTNP